jgi:hypothetical protein
MKAIYPLPFPPEPTADNASMIGGIHPAKVFETADCSVNRMSRDAFGVSRRHTLPEER